MTATRRECLIRFLNIPNSDVVLGDSRTAVVQQHLKGIFMNKSVRRILGLTAIAALLSACGGGGGDTPAPVTDSPLAGGWAGTSTSGNTLLTLILENGKIWAIGGTLSNGSLLVSGVVFGTLQTSGNTVSSSDVRSYSLSTGTSIAGTLAGTFTAGSSINATATPQTGSGARTWAAPPRTVRTRS